MKIYYLPPEYAVTQGDDNATGGVLPKPEYDADDVACFLGCLISLFLALSSKALLNLAH